MESDCTVLSHSLSISRSSLVFANSWLFGLSDVLAHVVSLGEKVVTVDHCSWNGPILDIRGMHQCMHHWMPDGYMQKQLLTSFS